MPCQAAPDARSRPDEAHHSPKERRDAQRIASDDAVAVVAVVVVAVVVAVVAAADWTQRCL